MQLIKNSTSIWMTCNRVHGVITIAYMLVILSFTTEVFSFVRGAIVMEKQGGQKSTEGN